MNEVMVPDEVKTAVESRVQWARSLVVRSQGEREQAGAVIREVKGLIAAIDARFDDAVKAAHGAWKSAVAVRDSFRKGPEEVERLCKAACVTFDLMEESRRRAEQMRLQAIADEQARKEKEALLKKAAAYKTPEKAEQARQEAAAIVPPTVHIPEAPKAAGESMVTNWLFKIVDTSIIPPEYKMVDESKIGKVVRATKGTLAIPGVEIYSTKSMRVRQ